MKPTTDELIKEYHKDFKFQYMDDTNCAMMLRHGYLNRFKIGFLKDE